MLNQISIKKITFVTFFISNIFFSSSLIGDSNQDFLKLLDDEWNYEVKQNPVYATSLGIKGFENKWTDMSLEAIKKRQDHHYSLLKELSKIDIDSLNLENQLNYRLFIQLQKNSIDLMPFNQHLMPFSHRGGIQLMHEQSERLRFEKKEDFEDWIIRLSNLDIYIDQIINLAKIGMSKGYTKPRVLMERVGRQISLQTNADISNHPFYKLFNELPDFLSKKEKEELKTKARKVINNEIIPSYQKLHKFFMEEYLPSCRESVGISNLPNGKKNYEILANQFTTTDLTPKEIHELGLKEVSRIKKEMKEIIKELNFNGSFQDFLKFLREDPQFYYDNEEDLLQAYLATSKRADAELVSLFALLPRTPYGVRQIPMESAPDTTTAYYMGPSPDGLRAGYYYVNLYKPETRPKFEIEVLSLHEAVPGHHLQIALAMEKESLPMFRRMSPYTAFVEGWGLYSESLGYDMGFYKDPYSKFGQLTYDMWRAVRLVVDTGLHYFDWEREKAIEFFLDNAGKSKLDIVNEIDRYINWPGQALAYKVGQLKIFELRDKAKKELGENFDIRLFHTALLSEGAIPLNELEIVIDAYIESNK
tara:strand:+ start:13992 stop:15758 length:1767 start_codon:yes stop_codon:yes gene_type:complete